MILPSPVFGLNGHLPPSGHPLHLQQPVPSGVDSRDLQIDWTCNGRTLADAGTNVAFIAPQPGPLTISRTIRGQNQPPQTFAPIIAPQPTRRFLFIDTAGGNDANTGADAQHPKKTPPPLASHLWLYFNADHVQDIAATWDASDLTDIRIGRYGTAPRASLRFSTQTCIKCNANTSDVSFVNLGLDSTAANPMIGAVYGRNLSLINCHLGGTFGNGIFDHDGGMLGLYLDGLSADVLNEYTLFLSNTQRLVLLNPDFAGSKSQITFRATGNPALGSIGLRDALLYGGSIRQPTTASKASLDFRMGQRIRVVNTACVNGNSSANSEGNYATEVSNLHYVNHTTTNCKLELHEGVYDVRIDGGKFVNPGSECLAFQNFPKRTNGQMAHDLDNIRVNGVTGIGAPGNPAHCLAKLYGATPQQVSVNNSTLYAAAGTPLFKDASSNPMNLGSGNKLVVA